ncbi:unnamed protein product [Paramecium primaurelia]|uniref:Uncharacterized protein n=1 Tax=Paramecium primaurelia TaxID=5886 RepID=A0A8S1PTY3_PARPR|nr:unnamed protein product [Paramecium primaurelia]
MNKNLITKLIQKSTFNESLIHFNNLKKSKTYLIILLKIDIKRIEFSKCYVNFLKMRNPFFFKQVLKASRISNQNLYY